jgi:hypothetical protein
MTYKPVTYFGGSVRQTVDDGGNLYHPSQTSIADRVLTPRVIRIYVNDTAGVGPATYHLPDATGLQCGWPVLVLIVEGSPTSNGFRVQDAAGSLVLTWTAGQLPLTITLGLVDNTTVAGMWTWCAKSAVVTTPPASPYVASFGMGGDNPNLVTKYNPSLNVWTADTALTFDAREAGASFSGSRSYIRAGTTVYSYALSTTTTENTGGSADGTDVAFCRVPPPSDGTITAQRDHLCFGKNSGGSYSNIIDRYRSDTNAIYVGTTPSWIDWSWCTASGSADRGPVGCLVSAHEGTPVPGYATFTPFFFYAPLFDTSTRVIDVPSGNWYRAHLVELLGEHHNCGGATFHNGALGPTAFHQKMDMVNSSAWVTLPSLVQPVFYHGAMGFSTTLVRSRAYYGMGRANAINEAANPATYYYDQYTQVSAVLRTDVWTNRHHQQNHWTQLG